MPGALHFAVKCSVNLLHCIQSSFCSNLDALLEFVETTDYYPSLAEWRGIQMLRQQNISELPVLSCYPGSNLTPFRLTYLVTTSRLTQASPPVSDVLIRQGAVRLKLWSYAAWTLGSRLEAATGDTRRGVMAPGVHCNLNTGNATRCRATVLVGMCVHRSASTGYT
jgi:hypothetical protein